MPGSLLLCPGCLPALPRTRPESHPPARPFGAHLKCSSAKTRRHQELGLFAVPQKGQDGDRYQGAGAAARCRSGGVVRLSRLSKNGNPKALHSSCPPFPSRIERADIASAAGSCGPNPNSILFRSRFAVARARKAGIVVPLALASPTYPPVSGFARLSFGCRLPANRLRSLLRVASHVAAKMALVFGVEVSRRPLFQPG